jgi:hypothetical protein
VMKFYANEDGDAEDPLVEGAELISIFGLCD